MALAAFVLFLAVALGEAAEAMDVSRNHTDPRPALQARGL